MILIEKDNNTERTIENVLCCSYWDKEMVIYVAKDRGIDLEDKPENFWKYLGDWIQNSEYYPSTSEDVMDCVNEVLKRKDEWNKE